MEAVFIVILVIAAIFVARSLKVVPQQHAWVVERLGKYHATLTPGLNILVPFIDRVAYRHSLKEIPLDVPSQVCITKDNTQLTVDGILYFQVTDPMRASYGASNYIIAITQLAQTTLRSVIGKMELDRTFEERTAINTAVVNALDEAALNWGVKVLRYEIKDLTPPAAILHAMQAQITAEREKRALIAASEGRRQEQINIATGEREAFIARSEGEKQAEINNAQGQAAAIVAVAEATADAIRKVAQAIREPGGEQAVQLKVAEKAVEAYSQLAQKNNTMIVPGNMSEVSGLIATAMAIINKGQAPARDEPRPQCARHRARALLVRPVDRLLPRRLLPHRRARRRQPRDLRQGHGGLPEPPDGTRQRPDHAAPRAPLSRPAARRPLVRLRAALARGAGRRARTAGGAGIHPRARSRVRCARRAEGACAEHRQLNFAPAVPRRDG